MPTNSKNQTEIAEKAAYFAEKAKFYGETSQFEKAESCTKQSERLARTALLLALAENPNSPAARELARELKRSMAG